MNAKDLNTLYPFVFAEKQAELKSDELDKLHDATVADDNIKKGCDVAWGCESLVKYEQASNEMHFILLYGKNDRRTSKQRFYACTDLAHAN